MQQSENGGWICNSQTHALPENIRQIVTLRFINDLKSTVFLNVVIMFGKKIALGKKYMMKMLNNNSNNGRTWLTDWPACNLPTASPRSCMLRRAILTS